MFTAQESMSTFSFYILFDKAEAFKGVLIKEGDQWKTYDVKSWNEKFTSLDPKSTSTGTNLESNE